MNDSGLKSVSEENEVLKQTLKDQLSLIHELELQIQNSSDSISGKWELDLQSKNVTWSENVYVILGLSNELTPDLKLFKDQLPPSALDKLVGAIKKVFVEGIEYSFEHKLLIDDEQRIARTDLKPIFNSQREPIKLIGKLTDITSVKNSQKDLERLSLVAAHTSNGVVMIDKSENIEWVNNAFTMMTGYRPDEVINKHFDEVLKCWNDHESRESFEKLFKSYKSIKKEFLIKSKKGTSIWVLLDISAVLDYELNPESYIVLITNISERKKTEEKLEEKNTEILDSIRYAKRLQDSMFPDDLKMISAFKEAFILFKPKDIVSGDFYWFREINNLKFIAAADCTGHGVPGAFVSLVCNRALNQAISEFDLTDPGHILEKARELITEAFNRKTNIQVKDGMDISLLVVDTANNKLMFSGANNPLYYFKNDEILEIKANKQPVGWCENNHPFVSHKVDYEPGSSIFLFTDGYADQFGGPKGKKLKYRKFKDILISNKSIPLEQLKDLLTQEFNSWKGSLEQVDDVCIIGIRL